MKDKLILIISVILSVILFVVCFKYIDKTNELEIINPSTNKEKIKIETPLKINVFHQEQSVIMDMEDYIIGVVAGEIYLNFSIEAIKAQAVAARTYLIYKMNNGGCAGGGDICTKSNHCQSYKTQEEMQKSWGNDYEKYFNIIKNAVYSTKGEIITYNNEPICALYHSESYGKTEDSISVFGGNEPYLSSVSSPTKETCEPVVETFSKTEFLNKVNQAFSLNLKEINLKITSYTSSGRVSTLKLGQTSVKATELRKTLSLRSTDFTFEISDESITFYTKGYGHGVGLSQWGANEMAKQGKTYKEILTHYYTGTVIQKLKSEQI